MGEKEQEHTPSKASDLEGAHRPSALISHVPLLVLNRWPADSLDFSEAENQVTDDWRPLPTLRPGRRAVWRGRSGAPSLSSLTHKGVFLAHTGHL